MSDTPETDAFAIKFKTTCGEKYWVPVVFARKLELERDEARRKLNNLDVTAIHSCHNECQRPICVLRRERDEAREALKRIAHASMSARHKEEDYAEWEKAVESLQGICEEKNFINE